MYYVDFTTLKIIPTLEDRQDVTLHDRYEDAELELLDYLEERQ